MNINNDNFADGADQSVGQKRMRSNDALDDLDPQTNKKRKLNADTEGDDSKERGQNNEESKQLHASDEEIFKMLELIKKDKLSKKNEQNEQTKSNNAYSHLDGSTFSGSLDEETKSSVDGMMQCDDVTKEKGQNNEAPEQAHRKIIDTKDARKCLQSDPANLSHEEIIKVMRLIHLDKRREVAVSTDESPFAAAWNDRIDEINQDREYEQEWVPFFLPPDTPFAVSFNQSMRNAERLLTTEDFDQMIMDCEKREKLKQNKSKEQEENEKKLMEAENFIFGMVGVPRVIPANKTKEDQSLNEKLRKEGAIASVTIEEKKESESG